MKVLDFGMAKFLELEQRSEITKLTRVGTCFGTPNYMSPEQIRGRPLDGRSDLFALGVIAYELVAGHRPWNGADHNEVMMKVAEHAPPEIETPRAALEDRDEELHAFFMRALAKRPADRFSNARELALAFDRALGASAQLPSTSSDDWFSELSSAVLNIRDLLDGPSVRTRKAEPSEPRVRLRAAWFDPIDSKPIRVAAPAPAARAPLPSARAKPAAAPLPPAPRARPRWPLGLAVAAVLIALGAAAYWYLRSRS